MKENKTPNDVENLLGLNSEELNKTADALENLAKNEEKSSEGVLQTFDIKEDDFPKIKQTVKEFLTDYAHKDKNITDKQFLINMFNKFPNIWKDASEIEQVAAEIVETVNSYEEAREELNDHIAQGKRRESWLARKIEQGAETFGAARVSDYAQKIDTAIDNANNLMSQTIRRLDGSINQNPNLDGFIAESYQASTFNIDAAVKEKNFIAQPLQSNAKNSPDIEVYNGNGNVLEKYQLKYGKDAKATARYFKEGDYHDQRWVVPEGQGDKIDNATEKIEIAYGRAKNKTIESKPLSKAEAKAKQEQAQNEGKIEDYTWNSANKNAIAKRIGVKATMAALFAIGFQGARIAGRRIWNCMTGKSNQTVEEDVKEFVESSLKSGASAGLTVALSGAVTVSARRGLLGKSIMKATGGQIAAAVCVGIEDTKILYKFAKGELTGEEAIDQAGRATCSVICGLVFSAKGAAMGAAIGTTFGPPGMCVGGVIGGIIGDIAGNIAGEAAYSAEKKNIVNVVKVIRKLASGIANEVEQFTNNARRFATGVFSL